MPKKNRAKKTSISRPKPMEQLLKQGEAETYGQLCWSLANRDTQHRHAGETIKVTRLDQSGQPVERKLRLTEASVENIQRCLGMRTCGEAIALFAEHPTVESRGECPHGHQEAALGYMMYGVMPTKRCPECGEIPTFGGAAMSLGFGSNEPVKGVDGQEYQRCPLCGDDLLELQGNDPVGWGWDIACTKCDWRIKQAEELDINQYCDLMEQIKLKVEAIQRLMEMPGIINQTRVESACLQLRMVLELIVFSSLVSNKDAWRKSQDELRKAWNINKIMKDLREIHDRYYPEPKAGVRDCLTKDRLVAVYDQLNYIVHAENPMGAGVDLSRYLESIPKWLKWCENLLNEHRVFLCHHPNVSYWVRMFGGPDGEVLCTPIKADLDGKEICSWPDCVQQDNRQHCEYNDAPWRECQLKELEPAQSESKQLAMEDD